MSKSTTPRPVVHPRVSFAVCAAPEKMGLTTETAAVIADALVTTGWCPVSYNPPLTHVTARALLGWEAEQEGGERFGEDYLLIDRYGRKVRCTKNVRNRPFYTSVCEDRTQDVLNGRWEFNCEPVLVSREDDILDGQHSLAGVVLAYEDWCTTPTWRERWPEKDFPDGPTMDRVVIYGVDGSDSVVNTMNTGKPRSLADVLYRSPYFASLGNKERVVAAKVTSSAISHVWHRTGMYLSNFGSRRTTAESVAWLEAHGGKSSKLLAAVKLVVENADNISTHVTLGYAAAACFLMGASDTPEQKVESYYADDERSSKRLVFTRAERAKEFWTAFGQSKPMQENGTGGEATGDLKELTCALCVIADDSDSDANTNEAKNYVITRAWAKFREGKKPREEDVTLVWTKRNKYGVRHLDNNPELGGVSFGGIDLGTAKVERPADNEEKNGTVSEHAAVTEATNGTPKKVKGPITSAAAQSTETLLATIHRDNPDFGLVFVHTKSGCSVWGDIAASMLVGHTTKTPRMHPRGIRHTPFTLEEVKPVIESLTDAGHVVALVSEIPAPESGDPPYTVDTVFRPKKAKGGA